MFFKNSFLFISSLVLLGFLFISTAPFDPLSVNGFRGDTILYKDVSLTNLPLAIVSGPGMDAETGDLDGDGDLDIVIANEYQPNKILLNNGLGVFIDGTPGRLPQKFLDS